MPYIPHNGAHVYSELHPVKEGDQLRLNTKFRELDDQVITSTRYQASVEIGREGYVACSLNLYHLVKGGRQEFLDQDLLGHWIIIEVNQDGILTSKAELSAYDLHLYRYCMVTMPIVLVLRKGTLSITLKSQKTKKSGEKSDTDFIFEYKYKSTSIADLKQRSARGGGTIDMEKLESARLFESLERPGKELVAGSGGKRMGNIDEKRDGRREKTEGLYRRYGEDKMEGDRSLKMYDDISLEKRQVERSERRKKARFDDENIENNVDRDEIQKHIDDLLKTASRNGELMRKSKLGRNQEPLWPQDEDVSKSSSPLVLSNNSFKKSGDGLKEEETMTYAQSSSSDATLQGEQSNKYMLDCGSKNQHMTDEYFKTVESNLDSGKLLAQVDVPHNKAIDYEAMQHELRKLQAEEESARKEILETQIRKRKAAVESAKCRLELERKLCQRHEEDVKDTRAKIAKVERERNKTEKDAFEQGWKTGTVQFPFELFPKQI